MCTIAELKRLIANLPDDMRVEFHDVTNGRECPVNSHKLMPDRFDPMMSRFPNPNPTRLILTSGLPRTFF